MTLGQWLLVLEAVGTVAVIVVRLARGERPTWRLAFSFVWPLVVLIVAVELLAKLVGHKFMGDKDWNKSPPRRGEDPDDDVCPVCRGHAVVPFDELEARADAVIDGKSEDLAADCRAFAPIVKHFVRRHRWDTTAARSEWDAETRGMEAARRIALQCATVTTSEEAVRAYENLARHLEFEIGRRGK